jgi:hypothetical protein
VHHLLLVHTIKGPHSSGQMLASCLPQGKNGVRRTITALLPEFTQQMTKARGADFGQAASERVKRLLS